jgi:hypothetical protein
VQPEPLPLRGTNFADAPIHYIEKPPKLLVVIRECRYRDTGPLLAARQVYALNLIQFLAKFLSFSRIIEWLFHI